MASPFIKPLQISGGTFYSFISPSKHLSMTFNNENLKFSFSKFVCLNLPNIKRPTNKENFVQFNTIDGTIFEGLNGDVNIDFAQSLQNYAFNLENLLINQESYDNTLLDTVSERVFFKWLKEIGAIRFREANALEKSSLEFDSRFVEENDSVSGQKYEKVVKYIGEIDLINNVQKGGAAYSELYLYIPTESGSTPTILFKTSSDANYYPNQIITGSNEYIAGRSSTDVQPAGLNFKAFYDYDNAVTYTDSDANWHGSVATNSYFTERTTFNNPANLEIIKTQSDYSSVPPFTNVQYLRSKLDGIGVDFDLNSYQQLNNNPNISNISQFNNVAESTDFKFNAVAIYYDVYNVSNPSERSTNLYGVLFLDNVTPDTSPSDGYIQRFEKFKQNPVTKLNGNSYGLRLNLKFDTSLDTISVENIINEYNTFSMSLFSDALVQMQTAAEILMKDKIELIELTNSFNNIKNYLFNNDVVTELTARIQALETKFNNSNLALAEANSLLDLIQTNSDRINEIFNGNVPLTIQYNTNVIAEGSGISLDKSVPNKIKITQKYQNYNTPSVKDLIITTDNVNVLILNEYNNYVNYTTSGLVQDNIIINIDDTIKWKSGQSLKIVLSGTLNFNGNHIEIYTDIKDSFRKGIPYGIAITQIMASQLTNRISIFEIICLNEYTYSFDVIQLN